MTIVAEAMTTRHGGRFHRSTCRRRPRRSAAEIDSELTPQAAKQCAVGGSFHLDIGRPDYLAPLDDLFLDLGTEFLL
jgi:hypothetical protein